jgi:RimJ/RimL family protein N-acetyltransferase
MIGDVNLFLTPADEDEEGCVGEIELMIARKDQQRRGYGRAAVLAFMNYIQRNLEGILAEYARSIGRNDVGNIKLLQLRVKIGGKNERSINLFEGIGFMKVGEGENYFGEVELVFKGFLGEGSMLALLDKYDTARYQEKTYIREEWEES